MRNLKNLSKCNRKKLSKVTTNIFVFDDCNILILDNSGTKSALIQSNEIFLSTIMNQFNGLWNDHENRIVELDNKIRFINNN